MSTPFDRILLCYDATPEGQHALRCGAALASRLGAETHLLSILELAWWPAGYDAFSSMKFDVDEDAAKEILEDGIAQLASWGVTATGHFSVGSAAEQIANLANSLNADLIVIGHRHRGIVTRWLAGGSHLELLEHVSCGVLFEVVG
ncbi:universal stress protein [Paraburkholderia phytofirmans]